LILKFRDGLQLEMMPGGLGAYTVLFPEIFGKRIYERCEFSFGPTPTIVDLGSNIGMFACKMAKQYAGGFVLAIEVMPPYCRLLRRNAQRSGLPNIKCVEAAVGDGSYAAIQYWFTETGYLKVTSSVPPNVRCHVLNVPTVGLGRLLDEHEVESCDLLKVDIEGHEYALFAAATRSDLSRCRQIALEWHRPQSGDDPTYIAEILQRANFRVLPGSALDGPSGLLYALRRG
jgi:FkbM family methyltransferase